MNTKKCAIIAWSVKEEEYAIMVGAKIHALVPPIHVNIANISALSEENGNPTAFAVIVYYILMPSSHAASN